MRKEVVLALISGSSAIAPTAMAQGFYVGLEVGESRSDIERGDGLVLGPGAITSTSKDGNDNAYGAYLGYTITKHFSIELAYSSLGESRYTEHRDVPPFPLLPVPRPPLGGGVVLLPERQDTLIESESFSLSLIGRYPLTATLFVTGRAGLAAHVSKSDLRVWFRGEEVTVVGGVSKQSSGAALVGAGIEWDLHPNWNARLQLQQHFLLEDEEFITNVALGDVTVYTVGIGYRF